MPSSPFYTRPWQRQNRSPIRTFRFWWGFAAALAFGFILNSLIERYDAFIDARYLVYTWVHSLPAHQSFPQSTALVEIGDQEFWSEQLAGRYPISRDYIAEIVLALTKLKVHLIALDFDFRSPSPEGNPTEYPVYLAETTKLVQAINEASKQCAVVIPQTIWEDGDSYREEPDIFEGKGLSGAVSRGYTVLPGDRFAIADYDIPLDHGRLLPSFAQAIVRAFGRQGGDAQGRKQLPFGYFIPQADFRRFSATEILRQTQKPNPLDPKDPFVKFLGGRAVIVGGSWSSLAYGRGAKTDLHETPLGEVSGVTLHATYVENLINRDAQAHWPATALYLLETLVAFVALLPFTFAHPTLKRLMAYATIVLFLILLSACSLMVLGCYFDFAVPAIVVLIHGALEQYRHLRHLARSAPAWEH